MAKRRLTARQRDHIARIQQNRLERARRRCAQQAETLTASGLGAEQIGLIIANHGRTVVVESEAGALHRCVTRQNLQRVVAGDRVAWQPGTHGNGVVNALGERHGVLVRQDSTGQLRPMAANIDRMFIVIAPKPAFDEYLLDRYLVAAHGCDIHPLVVLHKTDLLNAKAHAAILNRLQPYADLGYELILTSTRQSGNMQSLIDQAVNNTSILVGQSGVGKSSLINHLAPELRLPANALSERTDLGQHTTTATTLYRFNSGNTPDSGQLIDSPGVRAFALWAMSQHVIEQGYLEFRPLIGQCKFKNCRHSDEPECALRDAVANGRISATRMQRFRRICADVAMHGHPGRSGNITMAALTLRNAH